MRTLSTVSTVSVVAFSAACTMSDLGGVTFQEESVLTDPPVGPAIDGGDSDGGRAGGDPLARLLALTAQCSRKVGGNYRTDDNKALPENIPICGLVGAVFWRADMDIDCDGTRTATCNPSTDPDFQNRTTASDSRGNPLDAATLPYVVVPMRSGRFDYTKEGIELGSVILVLYNGQIRYGAFADEGPGNFIGEASVAMADSLGIDPDPRTGGVDGGVTYVAFTGASGKASPIEDHSQAVRVGEARLAQLLKDN